MPGILCDSKLCVEYRPKNKYPMQIPLISLYGDSDTSLGSSEVRHWQHYTTDEFKAYALEGDHFFVNNGTSKLKTMHLVADHLIDIYGRFVRKKAMERGPPRPLYIGGKGDPACENTPVVFIVSPGVKEEDVVHLRAMMAWTSRGIYTLSGTQSKCASDLAAEYLSQILKMKISGPYIIIGWSVGGIVAFDLATKLEALNIIVDKLIVFDCMHPTQLQDFDNCAKCPHDKMAEFVMQSVLQRHYMWPRYAKKWSDTQMEDRVQEFLRIYSAIVGRKYTREEFDRSIHYIQTWWNFGALRSHEYTFTAKLERALLVCLRPRSAGGLPLVDDIFNMNFQHTTGWNVHCNYLEIIDIPGDHFTMLPSWSPSTLAFLKDVFKSSVEWQANHHYGFAGRGHTTSQNGKKKYAKKWFPIDSGASKADDSSKLEGSRAPGRLSTEETPKSLLDVNCANMLSPRNLSNNLSMLSPRRRRERRLARDVELAAQQEERDGSIDEEDEQERLERLEVETRQKRQRAYRIIAPEVTGTDRAMMERFVSSIEIHQLEALTAELDKEGEMLSFETLLNMPVRAQDVLASSLGIAPGSIEKMRQLPNNRGTLKMVMRSYLKRIDGDRS